MNIFNLKYLFICYQRAHIDEDFAPNKEDLEQEKVTIFYYNSDQEKVTIFYYNLDQEKVRIFIII